MSLKYYQINCYCSVFLFWDRKNSQYSRDSKSEGGRYFRSHDIFQRESLWIFLIHDCEIESALVWSPMCCLEGCERENFSDLRKQQNIQTKNVIAAVIHFRKKNSVKINKFVKRKSPYWKEQWKGQNFKDVLGTIYLGNTIIDI